MGEDVDDDLTTADQMENWEPYAAPGPRVTLAGMAGGVRAWLSEDGMSEETIDGLLEVNRLQGEHTEALRVHLEARASARCEPEPTEGVSGPAPLNIEDSSRDSVE